MTEIPFTQFVLPRGRRRDVSIAVAPDVAAKAAAIIADGLCFECEELSTGSVALTITHPEDGDLAIRIHPNGPGIREEVEEMVRAFKHGEVR